MSKIHFLQVKYGDAFVVLGSGPEIKYLLETYCWGQALK